MSDHIMPSIVRINPPELGTPPGYSQVVEVAADRIIFIAGQTAVDSDGNIVGKNDFAAQAAQVFRNLGVALQASGCTAANLVKLTVFLKLAHAAVPPKRWLLANIGGVARMAIVRH